MLPGRGRDRDPVAPVQLAGGGAGKRCPPARANRRRADPPSPARLPVPQCQARTVALTRTGAWWRQAGKLADSNRKGSQLAATTRLLTFTLDSDRRGSHLLQQWQVVELRTEHFLSGAAEPLIEQGRVDAAEVG